MVIPMEIWEIQLKICLVFVVFGGTYVDQFAWKIVIFLLIVIIVVTIILTVVVIVLIIFIISFTTNI